jgi:hypothetical protein
MAGLILDSAGTIKMQVLDDALLLLQRINGLTESYAINAKKGVNSAAIVQNIRRQLVTLAGNLKSQFGMISDQVTNVYITSSRGASDAGRVRTLREGMAAIKQGIEIGMTQTVAKHAVVKHAKEKPAGDTKPEGAGS